MTLSMLETLNKQFIRLVYQILLIFSLTLTILKIIRENKMKMTPSESIAASRPPRFKQGNFDVGLRGV
jgi:hypothetical protein